MKITINDTTIEMLFEEGNPIISINASKIPFNSILRAIDRSMLVDVSLPAISYLYSYEQYSLNSKFWNYIKGINAKSLPKSILAEDGSNFIYLLDQIAIVIHQLNNALKYDLEENIELRLLKDGSLAIFDGIKEVENYYGVSDLLLSMIYYLTAKDLSILC